jgi:hypothetical protein
MINRGVEEVHAERGNAEQRLLHAFAEFEGSDKYASS